MLLALDAASPSALDPGVGSLALAATSSGAPARMTSGFKSGRTSSAASRGIPLVRSAVREHSLAVGEVSSNQTLRVVLTVDTDGLIAGDSAKPAVRQGAALPRAAARKPGLAPQAPSLEAPSGGQVAGLPAAAPRGVTPILAVAIKDRGIAGQVPVVVYATTAQPVLAAAPVASVAPATVVVAPTPAAPTGSPMDSPAPASEDGGKSGKSNTSTAVVIFATLLGLVVVFGCAGVLFYLCYVRPQKQARSRALMNAVGIAIDGNRMTRGKTPSATGSTGRLRSQKSMLHPTAPGGRDKSPASSSEPKRPPRRDSEVFEA